MAMTPLERKRLSLERKAERQRLAGDPTDKIAGRKFYEFLADANWSNVATGLEWAGINPDHIPIFDTDEDPGHDPQLDGDEPSRGSIGRAERMVGNLLDAASELARLINRYKREEIDRAIADLEAGDLADPAARKEALAQIVRLTKLRDQLEKQIRITLPQWRVTAL